MHQGGGGGRGGSGCNVTTYNNCSFTQNNVVHVVNPPAPRRPPSDSYAASSRGMPSGGGSSARASVSPPSIWEEVCRPYFKSMVGTIDAMDICDELHEKELLTKLDMDHLRKKNRHDGCSEVMDWLLLNVLFRKTESELSAFIRILSGHEQLGYREIGARLDQEHQRKYPASSAAESHPETGNVDR